MSRHDLNRYSRRVAAARDELIAVREAMERFKQSADFSESFKLAIDACDDLAVDLLLASGEELADLLQRLGNAVESIA